MVTIRKRGGAWREEIWDHIGRMRDIPVSRAPEAQQAIEDHLARAEEIANESYWAWFGRRGSRIEATWREVKLAEETQLSAADDQTVLSLGRDALRSGSVHLDAQDEQLQKLKTELAKGVPDPTEVRTLALDLLKRSHYASDAAHRQMRAVGEKIAAATTGLLLLAIAVAIVTGLAGLRLLPDVTNGTKPLGEWETVVLAMVAGLVGAMFSAVPSIAMIPDKGQTFNPVWRQAAFKMAVGAWSGLIGLMAVSAGLIAPIVQANSPGTPSGANLAGFLMTAALFGAGQEALSRFADRKATVARDAANTK